MAACDESLLRLLTADDPNGPFTLAITAFNKRLTELGLELSSQGAANHDAKLEGLMSAWLEFSNRYMVTPPEQARGDPRWQQKMEHAATRIGEIRSAVKDGRIKAAHDTVLAMSGEITTFFECFGLSPLKRLFVGISVAFEECQRQRKNGNLEAVEQGLSTATEMLASLTPRLTSETRPLYDRVFIDLQTLKETLRETSTVATAAFLVRLEATREDLQKLRDSQLMFEWFPAPTPIPTAATPSLATGNN